jgi:hypothetical protein
MAALDFGMALARGMLPKAEKAQKIYSILLAVVMYLNLKTGGTKPLINKFKGYRESEKGKEYMTKSQYCIRQKNVSRCKNSNIP